MSRRHLALIYLQRRRRRRREREGLSVCQRLSKWIPWSESEEKRGERPRTDGRGRVAIQSTQECNSIDIWNLRLDLAFLVKAGVKDAF